MGLNSPSKDPSAGAATTTTGATTTLPSTSNPTPPATATTSSRPIAITPSAAAAATAAHRPLAAPQLRPKPLTPLIPIYPDNLRPLYPPQHPVFPSQTLPSRPQLSKPSAAVTTEGIRYPVASSGRGFVAARPKFPDHRATVPGIPAGYPPPRSVVGYPPPAPPPLPGSLPRALGYGASESIQLIRPLQPTNLPSALVSLAGPHPVKGAPFTLHHPQPKVVPSQGSVPDLKEPNDRGRDDAFVIVKDRKVRISDRTSMYSLCRSWLRNGHPEQSQSQVADVVKTLPKPSPARASHSNSPKGQEADEDDTSFENLSMEELLEKHVKRAKRVRARLREERLQRITRYKSRLALLLPPLVEQNRNDTNRGT
ncbi:hypothetical protein Dimus_023398 [Dionaea muscipula]